MFRNAVRSSAAAAALGASCAFAVHTAAIAEPSAAADATAYAAHKAAFAQPAISKVKAAFAQPAGPSTLIVSPTYFPSLDDSRCQLGLAAARKAKSLGIELLLVDASPPEVRAALEDAGATVRPQRSAGKKGAALRECIEAATEQLPSDGIVCFQELEKVEMVALQPDVAAHVARSGADVCVPRREEGRFRDTYPVEQYHSESFANLHLDALGREAGMPSLDWTFGPVAFRASMARHWLAFDGELWDAQIVPFIRAARWHGARVESLTVSYRHSPQMRREEEGQPAWSDKRLSQLDFLFKEVAAELRREGEPD